MLPSRGGVGRSPPEQSVETARRDKPSRDFGKSQAAREEALTALSAVDSLFTEGVTMPDLVDAASDMPSNAAAR